MCKEGVVIFLYVDNFRGFADTLIPLKEVNFLVGENSTGKTSILSLIRMLASSNFWLSVESYNSSDFDFGRFTDYVTVNSDNKSTFKIGIIEVGEEEISEDNKKETMSSCLMLFRNVKGRPYLSRYYQSNGFQETRIKVSDKVIHYKTKTRRNFFSIEDFISQVFNKWKTVIDKDNKGYKRIVFSAPAGVTNLFFVLTIVSNYVSKIDNQDLMNPLMHFSTIGPDPVWIAPIRTKPKRTYDEYTQEYSPEGDHTPYLIKTLLQNRKYKKYMANYGQGSGLFENVEIKQYGRGASDPFELDVVLNNNKLNIKNVGYGVSQFLPVITELYYRKDGTWFLLQQPEIHLHPKAQAMFGSVVFNLSRSGKKRFVIETHSDFMIDRFRIECRKSENASISNSQILFFERDEKGNNVHAIEILQDGTLSSDQPKGYRNFFIKEGIELLGL